MIDKCQVPKKMVGNRKSSTFNSELLGYLSHLL
uniref:Uncharacterized protein n=1 Tax=Rhizophora mucronata TaxID=61149 RepID=A0A2P2IS55_RHIMU